MIPCPGTSSSSTAVTASVKLLLGLRSRKEDADLRLIAEKLMNFLRYLLSRKRGNLLNTLQT
jgi:hypothetical protein